MLLPAAGQQNDDFARMVSRCRSVRARQAHQRVEQKGPVQEVTACDDDTNQPGR